MTSLTTHQSNHDSLLRNALRANAAFCSASALLAIFGAGMLVSFLGAGTSLFFIGLGILLILHAAILYYATTQGAIPRALAWYAIAGDVGWVIASAGLLLTDAFGLSDAGKWVTLIVADTVLVFAIVQIVGVRRLR